MIEWSLKPNSVQLDLLVFAAHPDDAELMAAGTLILMSKNFKVGVIDVTKGELSTNGTPEDRQRETALATKIMGIQARGNLNRKDGYLYQDTDLTEALTLSLRLCQPKAVIGPPPQCRHPDHQALHDHLKRAIFYSGLKNFLPDTPAIVRPKSFQYLEVSDDKPDFCIDISAVWEQKKQAILAYESQFTKRRSQAETFINSGFIEKLEQRFKSYGDLNSSSYAEPFLSESSVILYHPKDAFF
jgi:bacillithiol biosynthesis deacetylase BshB1